MRIQFLQTSQKYVIPFFLFALLIFGCKSVDPSNSPGPSPIPPPAISSVNVPLLVPRETLNDLINGQIPNKLMSEENLDMGSGINGDLEVIRKGVITWSVLDSQRIELKVPVTIKGQVGLDNRGLGSLFKSKIPIDEEFEPVFIVDPMINSDWTVSSNSFELVDLGGNLQLDVLGMQVDLSGLLRKQINKWASQNLTPEKTIVSLKTLVDLAWGQAGKPFMVDWAGGKTAFSIQPTDVKLKEYFDSDQNLSIWLGMQGKVNAHPADAAPSRAFPLPSLSPNDDSGNQLEIMMPLTISYDKLDQLMRENVVGKRFRVDKKTTLTPSEIKTTAYGELLAIDMAFNAKQTNGKELDGKLFIVGKPTYDSESKSLTFTDVNFKLESGNFGAQTSVGLKKRKIIRQIEKKAIFPIGDVLDESVGSIVDRLGINTPVASLKIEELDVSPSGFYPTKFGLIIHMKARGTVDVNWK